MSQKEESETTTKRTKIRHEKEKCEPNNDRDPERRDKSGSGDWSPQMNTEVSSLTWLYNVKHYESPIDKSHQVIKTNFK